MDTATIKKTYNKFKIKLINDLKNNATDIISNSGPVIYKKIYDEMYKVPKYLDDTLGMAMNSPDFNDNSLNGISNVFKDDDKLDGMCKSILNLVIKNKKYQNIMLLWLGFVEMLDANTELNILA